MLTQRPSTGVSIVSPSDGTVVRPGETISVKVRVASTVAVDGLDLISPLGISKELRKLPPWSFTLVVPTDETGLGHALIGMQEIYVSGSVNGRHDGVPLDVITVDVEEPDVPKQLTALMSGITMESIGEQSPSIAIGRFPDGHELEVNGSAYISWESAGPAVATVDSNGMVTAVVRGNTSITATYNDNGQSVQLVVPVTVLDLEHFAPRP